MQHEKIIVMDFGGVCGSAMCTVRFIPINGILRKSRP